MNQSMKRRGIFARAWVRLFGESDPIERQLAAIAREGATLARLAHICALLMLILFSAGSLVALAGDSIAAIAAGHATLPAMIAAGVSGLLVACMDTAMLYAASILRMLAARHADKREGRLHRFVLFGVAILEAATYGYMSWLYERPSGVAWALIGARALAAPLLSVYLSLARPLPVMARDMLALGERISGEGVLRDLAHIAGDTSAPLAEKVKLYIAAALIAPEDKTRLDALLDAAQERVAPPPLPPVEYTPWELLPRPPRTPPDAPDTPPLPTGPGTPQQMPTPAPAPVTPPNIFTLPTTPKRTRRKGNGRKAARAKGPAKGKTNAPVLDKARAAWREGMTVAALEAASGISHGSAMKYHAMLKAEDTARREQQAQQASQAVQ